jgi:hypothetical protein
LNWIPLPTIQTIRDNERMSTVEKTSDIDRQVLADRQAVFQHAFAGAPLDPEVARRVRERARTITERVRREYGMVNVVQLVRDGRP